MKLLKKITDKKILYIFTSCILMFLPILKQGAFYLVSYGVINNYDSINPAYVLYFCIPFLIYVYIKNLIKTKRKLDIYDYLFYTLIFVGILVTIVSMDKQISLFGKAYRHEGFFALLCYYLLFITWKVEGNKKDIKNIINIIMFMAIFNSIYALLQLYSPFRFILRFGIAPTMASGLCGNPNFLGSLMVTALSIFTTKFLMDKITIKNVLLLILFFVTLVNAQSLGPLITYAITIIFLIIFLVIKKKIIKKNIIYLIIILICVYIPLTLINRDALGDKNCELCNFVNVMGNEQLSKKDKVDTVGSGRMEIWTRSLDLVAKRPILGVGYDNFYLAYYEGINLTEVTFVSVSGEIQAVKKYKSIVDNAHNIYLHTLVTSGFLGLIPYLILCLYTFIRGLKTKENLVMLLLGGFVAYSIQAFANINVLQVTPIYYIIIGLILSIKE